MSMRTLLFVLLAPRALTGQTTSAALSGTVDDPTGAVMANVKVTLAEEGTGFIRASRTSKTGFFSFADLTPAQFTLSVEAPGFKMYRQTGIQVTANEERSLGQIRLEVGRVNETVTVTSDSTVIELATGERSGTLSGEQLNAIALRGRDIFDA